MNRSGKVVGIFLTALFQILIGKGVGLAQTGLTSLERGAKVDSPQSPEKGRASLYVDPSGGVTVDEAVSFALSHHGELLAVRKELEAARARVRQAGFRANPKLDVSGSQNVTGPDNGLTVTGMLPLELGGRRPARVAVAEGELELRREMLADRERILSAEVRLKFGAALSEVQKLSFLEELLDLNQKNYTLVSARVTEGRSAALEGNVVLVDLNRMKSERETRQGKLEVLLLELKNLIGMDPEEPLRLRGGLADSLGPPPSLSEATQLALGERPDLKAARAAERLAEAHVLQARAEGRFDAGLTAQYQYMNFGYPLRGFNDAGRLEPVEGRFHYLGVGVTIDLPLRNKNEGAVAAAVAEREAAAKRREFIELTVRREVAAAYARFDRAGRAAEIFQSGVRGQAGQNLSVLRRAYELGSKTLLDYVAEQRRFVEVETGFIDSLLEIYQSRVEISRSTASPELIKR